ncbi:MAG: hypothetical protein CML42_07870 [Rhodobacteraceae bacterium]|nr:hypothetical protein [Paracoccaceae bacterium]|tara:strand:+ start:39208 stop:39501 length:294 start_codon:yes stop_codon:yes gene_type:complete
MPKTRKKLSPIKERAGEKKTFKRKYKTTKSKTNPRALLKKNIKVLLTASSFYRRTKKAPKTDGHGKKIKLPVVARKSRKKKKSKKRKYTGKKKKKRK